jgi:C-terminal processing protease CtpA/Prc
VIPADWADWRVWAGEYGIALPARDDTLYLSDPDTTLWWRTLPESHTLYVRYQRVQFVDSADASAIAAAAADPEVTSVVFDLRQNPGGDNHSIAPLLSVLRDATVNQPGRLYVLTDRLTFSAAANFATQLEQTTDAVFAGEQIGGGLNFWDDVRWVDLPHYPLAPRVGVSTRYWQFAAPDDPRLTIEPDILVHVSASDYFAGRDPVMEAVTAQ